MAKIRQIANCVLSWLKRDRQRRPPEFVWTKSRVRWAAYGGAAVIYLELWAILSERALHLRYWIELLNGATWPDPASPWMFRYHNAWFSAILALRMLLNVSALLAGFVVLVEYLLIKRGEVMKVGELMYSREAVMLNAVARALNVTTVEQLDEMRRAADDAAREWHETYLPRLIGPSAASQVMEAELALKEAAVERARTKISP